MNNRKLFVSILAGIMAAILLLGLVFMVIPSNANGASLSALKQQLEEKETSMEAPEKEIILQVSPEKLPVIKTEIINGKKCIIIPLEDDEKATINGNIMDDEAPF